MYDFTPNVYINNEEEVSRDEVIAQCVSQSNSFSSDCNRWAGYGGAATAAGSCNKLGGRKRLLCEIGMVIGVGEAITSYCDYETSESLQACFEMQLSEL